MKDIEEVKTSILNLWKKVDRPGADRLLTWLEEGSDFFEAPASTKFHLARPGGLAQHSFDVYLLLTEKVRRFELDVHPDTITICGLGHDLCKVNYYKEDDEAASPAQAKYLRDLAGAAAYSDFEAEGLTKAWASKLIEYYKSFGDGGLGLPEKPFCYKVDDQFPFGHGEKSVSVLQDFIPLTNQEKLAIRWHMNAWDPGVHHGYPSGPGLNQASEKEPLVVLLFTADYETTRIVEAGE